MPKNQMEENQSGSDDDLSLLFDQVSNKLGWKSGADFDQIFEQLSQSTKKKKTKRPVASGKKKKKGDTTAKKETRDVSKDQSRSSGAQTSSQKKKILSPKSGHDSSSLKADITNEVSRSLMTEFYNGGLKSSILTRDEESNAKLLKENKDCIDVSKVCNDVCRTATNLEELNLQDKPQLDLERASLNREYQNLKNEDNFQETENTEKIPEIDENDSDKKLDMLFNTSPVTAKPTEDENENIFTKDFTESPKPMQWLMSPPASKPHKSRLSPLQCANSDSIENEPNIISDEYPDDIGDIDHFPSLSERLSRKHNEEKRKEKASKKNRRRSCANPRSARFLLDEDWKDDQDKDKKENADGDGSVDAAMELEANGDGEEERTCDKDEEQKNNVRRGFKETCLESVSKKKDEDVLDTRKESFQKARLICQDSSSDDDFEAFLNAVKTPKHPTKQTTQSDPEEPVYVIDDDDFIDDRPIESRSDDNDEEDEIFYLKVNNLDNPMTNGKEPTTSKKRPTVGSRSGSILSQLISSDDDDSDDDVFMLPNRTPTVKKPSSKVPISTTTSKKTPAHQRRPLQPTSLPTNRCFSTPSRTEDPTPVSFLASLSTPGKGMSTRSRYVSDFKRNKDELTQKLFKLYNASVFENKLPSDFSITWNNRMRKTAGFCFYKKKLGERTARIELSVKVCDTAERLRDTLVHELCHAAAWLIHGVSDGHGKFWKYWAAKANLAHPEIPIIKRCHTYEITTKYKYKCVQCGNIIGRHSKSVDTKRFCCAYCNGRLELQPTLRKDGTPATPRGPNPFANFVKENYASVKKMHGSTKHADVMRLLSQEFSTKTKITDK